MKNLFTALLIIAMSFLSYQVFAATRINSINVNFTGKTATIQLEDGTYEMVNQVNAVDNTIYQINRWFSSGQRKSVSIVEPSYSQMINTLSQENALNLDAVTNILTSE